MRGLVAIVGVTFLVGCQSVGNILSDRDELAWQALHVVDVAQTLNAASDPCYVEAFPVTRALIGEQPSQAEVLAWGVGTAALHYWVSTSLKRTEAPGWAQKLWAYTTITFTGYTVATNHGNGVRVSGSNNSVAGCGR